MSAAASADARPARLLLREARTGVLATQSVRFPGFPFGSAVACATDPAGRPLLLVSDLAAHTRNMAADDRVSVCVHAGDVLAGPRVTLVGRVRPADDDPGARERYLALCPEARTFASLGDFRLLRLEPEGGHYVGGFGDIRAFDRGQYLAHAPALQASAAEIVEHMNHDHADALGAYARHFLAEDSAAVRMLAVDCDGIDLLAGGRVRRIAFDEPVADPAGARAALVAMAVRARGANTPG